MILSRILDPGPKLLLASHTTETSILCRQTLSLARNIPVLAAHSITRIKQSRRVNLLLKIIQLLIRRTAVERLLEVRLENIRLAGVRPRLRRDVPNNLRPVREVDAEGRHLIPGKIGRPRERVDEVDRGVAPRGVDGVVFGGADAAAEAIADVGDVGLAVEVLDGCEGGVEGGVVDEVGGGDEAAGAAGEDAADGLRVDEGFPSGEIAFKLRPFSVY